MRACLCVVCKHSARLSGLLVPGLVFNAEGVGEPAACPWLHCFRALRIWARFGLVGRAGSGSLPKQLPPLGSRLFVFPFSTAHGGSIHCLRQCWRPDGRFLPGPSAGSGSTEAPPQAPQGPAFSAWLAVSSLWFSSLLAAVSTPERACFLWLLPGVLISALCSVVLGYRQAVTFLVCLARACVSRACGAFTLRVTAVEMPCI